MGSRNLTSRRSGRVACGSGLVALDLLLSPNVEGVPAYAGGTCGNVLTILAFLGWESYPIARIGADPAGVQLRRDLERCGVNVTLLDIDQQAQTPIIVQQNRRGANGVISHRFIWQCPSCKEYLPTFRPPTLKKASGLLQTINRQDLFFFDRVAPSTVALAEASYARGSLVFFEPSKVGSDRLFQRALRSAHIVKYARDRIPTKRGLSVGHALEIQTLGKDGLRYKLPGGRWTFSPASVPVRPIRDSSGAGDWTTAGIVEVLTRFSKNISMFSSRSVLEAVRYGQALAAINCEYDGARGAMYELSARQINSRVQRLVKGATTSLRPLAPSGLTQDRYTAAYCTACWPREVG